MDAWRRVDRNTTIMAKPPEPDRPRVGVACLGFAVNAPAAGLLNSEASRRDRDEDTASTLIMPARAATPCSPWRPALEPVMPAFVRAP
jgi:hypothetical protein